MKPSAKFAVVLNCSIEDGYLSVDVGFVVITVWIALMCLILSWISYQ